MNAQTGNLMRALSSHEIVFHYDDARGIMIASGRQAAHVLMLQPETVTALGFPKPTDPKYPYK